MTKLALEVHRLHAPRTEGEPEIIWAKERLVIGRGDYHWQHEPCWYAVREKGHWTGDRKQTTLWTIASGGQDTETVHGTQKPVECMRRPMLNNSELGAAVYDPFLGSGTSLIAAETVGRSCFAAEIDPVYVDVAIRRWQAFTGQNAILTANGETFEATAAQRLKQHRSADACGPSAISGDRQSVVANACADSTQSAPQG